MMEMFTGKVQYDKLILYHDQITTRESVLTNKDYSKQSIELHLKTRGKIEIKSKVDLMTKNDMSLAYTPGVAAVCMEIGLDKQKSYTSVSYTHLTLPTIYSV